MILNAANDVRFAARAAGISAYIGLTLGRYEIESRGKDPRDQERLITEAMLRFGRHMCALYGIETTTQGIPGGFVPGADAAGRGRVFVCNHRSGLDILVTLKLLSGKHVSRADLANWAVVGPIARRAGILFVDRESRRSAAAVVQQMITVIEKGIGVIIFPEGTTYAGDEVRPFKPGAFAVARRTSCEIVPVGLAYGDGLSFGEETFVEHMRRVSGKPRTRVAVAAGAPLRAEPGEGSDALSNRAHAALQALVHDARRLL